MNPTLTAIAGLMFARPTDKSSGDSDREVQFQIWIRQARAGSSAALGAMIEACQSYLLVIARRTIPEVLRSKCDPHDLVQETAMAVKQRETPTRSQSPGRMSGTPHSQTIATLTYKPPYST
jgi:hypothetical protein